MTQLAMLSVTALWLPILVAAGIVFVASFLTWMVLPHHRSDWKGLADEEGVVGTLRGSKDGAGQYAFPYMATQDAMKDPAWVERFEKGPSGFLVLRAPGPMAMGRSLAFSFLHDLVLAFLVGYVASCSLPRGTSFPLVFRVTAVTALLAFGGAWPVLSTWFAHRWCVTWKHVLDAAIYAALVGAVFAWLWPR